MRLCYLILLFSFLLQLSLQAQPILPDFSYDTSYCSDLGRSINVLNNWDVYQTTDGRYDGPHTCFEYVKVNLSGLANIEVDIADIDTSLPVFIRAKLDSPILLEDDGLYMINAAISSSSFIFKSGNTCEDGLCSGIFLSIQIPDSTGDSTASREYIIPGENDFNYTPRGFVSASCEVTENFNNGNYLNEITTVRLLQA